MDASHVLSGLRQITPNARLSDIEVISLAGGASNRTYHRVVYQDRTWVVMVLADEPIRSEEATSGPVPDELPFVEVGRYLAARQVPVPRIHWVDESRGHLWLDDLGDTHLLQWLTDGGAVTAGYAAALDALVAFQRATVPGLTDRTGPRPICYARTFEPALLRWELDHWIEWRVEAQLERRVTGEERQAFNPAFDALVSLIDAQPKRLVHRDYQSTNLMVTGPTPSLTIIDYQDALVGSWTYDLVALLRDSYVDLPATAVDELISSYLQRAIDAELIAPTADLDTAFRADFHRQTLQRKLKDAGRFVYIDRVKGNPWYLQYIMRTMRFVREALEWLEADGSTPHIASLAATLRALDPESFA